MMKPIALRIASVGRYVPERIVTAPEMDRLLGPTLGSAALSGAAPLAPATLGVLALAGQGFLAMPIRSRSPG
jgi:hypothetical protein